MNSLSRFWKMLWNGHNPGRARLLPSRGPITRDGSAGASPYRENGLSPLFLFISVFLIISLRLPASEPQPSPTNKPALRFHVQEPADYNHPPRIYEERMIRGWTIHVEKELLTNNPSLAEKVLARFDLKLGEALATLPRLSHTNFQRLSFFILYGKKATAGGRDNGLEYFPTNAPEHYPHLDPRMGRSIVIYSADNYVFLTDFWALKAIVHELAHAQQLEQWPEDQPDILKAYQHAMTEGLYRHVRDLDGKVLDEGYAITNPLEYFAELSCAYFVGCHYYPFDREQLKIYDPMGYAMIRKLWGVDE